MASGDPVSRLPRGWLAASGEHVVARAAFRFSVVVFLSTKPVLTDRRLAVDRPNTLLGIIPLGGQQFSVPVSNIAWIAP
jgi:hypothetical protein